jgi:hypothetical protein
MIFNLLNSLITKLMFPFCFLGLGSNPMTGQMKQAANQAEDTATQYGSEAEAEAAQLNPFFSQMMKAQHGLTGGQIGEELTAAEAGAGGAVGGLEGTLKANAARTNNATGVGKTLDEMARDRAKAAAGASEGIAAQDVGLAKQENMEGAKGMQGLYGTDVSGQLGAMKQQGEDISSAAQMEGQGWLKNIVGMAGQLGQAASGAGAFVNSNPNGIFGS